MKELSRSFSLLVCLVLMFSALPISAQTTQIHHGVPWRDARAPSASAPVGAHLSYFGGPVVSNAHVVQVLYGTGSYNLQVAGSSSPTMGKFFTDLLGTSSGYIDLLNQYSTNISGGTNQLINNGTFDGIFQIAPSAANNAPPGSVTTVPPNPVLSSNTNQVDRGQSVTFSWTAEPSATSYQVIEAFCTSLPCAPPLVNPFVYGTESATTTSLQVTVTRSALFQVKACNLVGCDTGSEIVGVTAIGPPRL